MILASCVAWGYLLYASWHIGNRVLAKRNEEISAVQLSTDHINPPFT